MTRATVARSVTKALISVFLIYHVSCIILMPNGLSFLGRQFGDVYYQYARLIGVATNWALFAPDPADPFFMTYQIYRDDEVVAEGYLPEGGELITVNPGKRRYLYFVRQLIVEPHKIEKIMAPWLCRKYENADRVKIRGVVARMPLLDQVLAYQNVKIPPISRMLPVVNYYCVEGSEYYFE